MLLPDVDVTDEFKYDGHVSYELYLNYLKGIATEDHMLRYLKRLVLLRLRKKYMHLGREVLEDLTQHILTEIWIRLVKQEIPAFNAKGYHAYLYCLIQRQTGRGFSEIYDNAPKILTPEDWEGGYMTRYSSTEDVEDLMFLEEFPKHARITLVRHLRLREPGAADAVVYILGRLFRGKRVVANWLKVRYGISNPRFFTEHVLIRLRALMYACRSTFCPRNNAFKRQALEALLGGANG